jgi:hypothetical protein
VSEPDKSPVEAALDVLVYAPIGLVFDGPALFPKLVERGRNQVAMARTIGQFAVQQGQVEAGKVASRLSEQATDLLGSLADRPDGGPAPASTAPPAPPPPVAPEAAVDPDVDVPEVAELAIPDYDSLSASQVVNRLAGLSAAELSAVQAYETAGRGRKTVLNKIAQLQRG